MILQIVKELEAKKHFLYIGTEADNSMNIYMRGAGADNPNGVNFEHHRKLLSL